MNNIYNNYNNLLDIITYSKELNIIWLKNRAQSARILVIGALMSKDTYYDDYNRWSTIDPSYFGISFQEKRLNILLGNKDGWDDDRNYFKIISDTINKKFDKVIFDKGTVQHFFGVNSKYWNTFQKILDFFSDNIIYLPYKSYRQNNYNIYKYELGEKGLLEIQNLVKLNIPGFEVENYNIYYKCIYTKNVKKNIEIYKNFNFDQIPIEENI